MEIKIVNRPMQDKYTKPEDVQYPNESWCVTEYMYREGAGGLKRWFNEIELMASKGAVVLYEIKTFVSQICDGFDKDGKIKYFDDITHNIRCQFKTEI